MKDDMLTAGGSNNTVDAGKDALQEAAFVAQMHRLAEVQECHCITGGFSYLLKVRVRDTSRLEAFLREEIKSLPGVVRTETMIALSTSKETLAVGIVEGNDPKDGALGGHDP